MPFIYLPQFYTLTPQVETPTHVSSLPTLPTTPNLIPSRRGGLVPLRPRDLPVRPSRVSRLPPLRPDRERTEDRSGTGSPAF